MPEVSVRKINTLKSDESRSAVKWKMLSFIQLHLDYVFLVLGFIFFLIGLLNIVPFPIFKEYGSYSNIPFYETIYSVCFEISTILFTAFIALRFELFSYSSRKMKLSAVMTCLSFPLIIAAVLFEMYREVVAEIPVDVPVSVGVGIHTHIEFVTMHFLVYNSPYAVASPIITAIGIVLLLFGIVLKMRA